MPFQPINRRKFIRVAAGTGGAVLAVDGLLIEPNRPQVVRREIALRRWPARMDEFTIALLSDFHYDPYFSVHPLRASIGMVNDLRPDLIVLTGDFVSVPFVDSRAKAAAADAEPCAQLLRQMQAPLGLWAVLGNHDALTDPIHITNVLRTAGINVLADQSVPVEKNGGRFWLSGVKDVIAGNPDLGVALQNVSPDEATILLAHEPDYADSVARHPVDLQLSGHSHGGQIRLPFLPPLWLPELARKYVWGLYKIGDLTLYTNPGLGTVGIPVRLDCPPEVTLITLRRAAKV